MKLRLITAAVLAATSIAGSAAAQEQPWLSDRRLGEGIGIRTGNFELHPGVALEAGYDSNYFLRPGGTDAREDKVAVFRLRLTPSLSLSTLGERRRNAVAPGAAPEFVMRASLWGSYNELVAADSQYSEEVSDQRHFDAGIGLKADIAPAARIGGDLYGDFIRTAEPSKELGPAVAFDRGLIRGGAGLTYRPGGGLFEWRLGYELRINYFETDPYLVYDNYWQAVMTRGRWRFLPRTAILYDAEYGWVRYTNRQTPQNDGEDIQVRGGLNGLITNRFAFLALLGWNSSFFVDRGVHQAQNYDGLVAHGELKWFLLAPPSGNSAAVGLSSIAAGYVRNFSTSYLGSFYIRDRGYAKFDYFVGGVFLFSAEAGLGHYRYPTFLVKNGQNLGDAEVSDFAETRIDLRLFGEYRLSDTLAVNSTLIYDSRVAGDPLPVTSFEPPPENGFGEEDIDYKRFQAWIAARWFM